MVERARLRRRARRRSCPSPLLSQAVAKLDRKLEPWSALLDEGRADGRLVREAREGPGRAEARRGAAGAARRRARGAVAHGHRASSTRTRRRRCTLPGRARRSSRPARPPASRCASTCRRSTCSAATRAPARSTSTRRRRSRRTRRARSRRSASRKRVRPAIYDGDTPREARAQIRSGANLVLTNPDMLHVGHPAQPRRLGGAVREPRGRRHRRGARLPRRLRLARRKRAAPAAADRAAYGTEPRFLLTSATIANPVELAERLTGLEPVALIDDDGSPAPARADRDLEPAAHRRAARRAPLGARRGGGPAGAGWSREGARTICFMKSRKGVELLSRLVREQPAATQTRELAELVVPYRAGYTAQQRRELEARLMRGELRAVITTDALELGIDVGELDAAVVVTFPGTVASLRQMWGRAGRRERGLARLRRRRGRARPVLLPPSRRVPRPPRRGGDPRPREPADLRRAPALRRARGPARRRGRRVPRPALGGLRGAARERGRAAHARARARHAKLRAAPRRPLSGGRGLAALGLARQLCDRRRGIGRAARPDRGRARLLDRPRRRDLPAPGALL